MSVWGVTMIKDEADIVGYTLPRMAAQLDGVIVADNMSTDGTRDIVRDWAHRLGNIVVVDDDEPAYFQSQKMTALAQRAADRGATWIVPFDADEVWSGWGPLRETIPMSKFDVLEASLFDHVVTGADDPDEVDPVIRIAYARKTHLSLPKIACRVRPGMVIEQGNHGVRYPGPVKRLSGTLTVQHFPYRSAEQMARKARNGAAAYAAAGDRIPPTAGQHWRDYGRFYDEGGLLAIEEIFRTWFYLEEPDDTVSLVPCPIPMPS